MINELLLTLAPRPLDKEEIKLRRQAYLEKHKPKPKSKKEKNKNKIKKQSKRQNRK